MKPLFEELPEPQVNKELLAKIAGFFGMPIADMNIQRDPNEIANVSGCNN